MITKMNPFFNATRDHFEGPTITEWCKTTNAYHADDIVGAFGSDCVVLESGYEGDDYHGAINLLLAMPGDNYVIVYFDWGSGEGCDSNYGLTSAQVALRIRQDCSIYFRSFDMVLRYLNLVQPKWIRVNEGKR